MTFKPPLVPFLCFILFGSTSAIAQIKVKDSIAIYMAKNELIKALHYAKQKTTQYTQTKQFENLKQITIKKSKIYSKLNENDKSLQLIYKTIACLEKNKSSVSTAELHLELGGYYSILRDTAMSFKSFTKAMKLAQKTADETTLKNAYQNLFRLHTQNSLDSSYYYMKKKFVLDKKMKNDVGLASSYNNHFVYYTLKNQVETAKKYLDSSYQTSMRTHSNEIKISSLSNLGYYYMVHKEDFKRGASYYHETLDKFETEMTDNELINVYLNLAYAYENMEDYKSANHYLNTAQELKDKVINTNINDAVKKVETRYQIEKIEDEYAEKSKKLEDEQLLNRKIIIFFASLFGLSCILFYFFYQNLQLKQRNKIKEIDSAIQENIISASMDGQELERKKLAETLHDNISALLSSAGLHLSAFMANSGEQSTTEISKVRALLKEAHDRVRDLSHELVPPLLAKLGLVYALEDLCEKNSNSVMQFQLVSPLSSEKKFPDDFELRLYFIITELFNNIIKHSKASEAWLYMEETNNQLHIKVSDNGVGMDLNTLSSTDGFGLTQLKARIKALNGTIQITSNKQQGTEVTLQVPVPQTP